MKRIVKSIYCLLSLLLIIVVISVSLITQKHFNSATPPPPLFMMPHPSFTMLPPPLYNSPSPSTLVTWGRFYLDRTMCLSSSSPPPSLSPFIRALAHFYYIFSLFYFRFSIERVWLFISFLLNPISFHFYSHSFLNRIPPHIVPDMTRDRFWIYDSLLQEMLVVPIHITLSIPRYR